MSDIQKDHVIKDFFRNPKRFADLMNALLFSGQDVMKPNELQRLDSSEIVVGDFFSKERRRDAIMLWTRKDYQVIMTLEAQSQVDYTMVSRTRSMMHSLLTCKMIGR